LVEEVVIVGKIAVVKRVPDFNLNKRRNIFFLHNCNKLLFYIVTMKKVLLAIALLFFTETNYADKKRPDEFTHYLTALNTMSGLFSRLLDDMDTIIRRPDRVSFKDLAVNFNRKLTVLMINENHFITIINRGGFSDKAFPNSLRIMEKNVADLKKILTDNRGLFDQLKMSNFNSSDVYDHLDTRLYENDLLLSEIKTRHNKAFKQKVVDNLMQAVVILNECHSKVSALYSKLK